MTASLIPQGGSLHRLAQAICWRQGWQRPKVRAFFRKTAFYGQGKQSGRCNLLSHSPMQRFVRPGRRLPVQLHSQGNPDRPGRANWMPGVPERGVHKPKPKPGALSPVVRPDWRSIDTSISKNKFAAPGSQRILPLKPKTTCLKIQIRPEWQEATPCNKKRPLSQPSDNSLSKRRCVSGPRLLTVLIDLAAGSSGAGRAKLFSLRNLNC